MQVKARTQFAKRGCFLRRRAGHAAAALNQGHGAAAELSARHHVGTCATDWQLSLPGAEEAGWYRPGCGLEQSVSQTQARRSYSSTSMQSPKRHTARTQVEA